MKKYIAPFSEVINVEPENIIAASLTDGGLGDGIPADVAYGRDWFRFEDEEN